MARLKCTCGNGMSNSDAPSTNTLRVFTVTGVELALENDPSITLFDFETSVDGDYEYWYCPVCQRVHMVENIPNGTTVRTYIVSTKTEKPDLEKAKAVYVFSATEIYNAEEENFRITLKDFIKQTRNSHKYYIDEAGKMVYAADGSIIYEIEK